MFGFGCKKQAGGFLDVVYNVVLSLCQFCVYIYFFNDGAVLLVLMWNVLLFRLGVGERGRI